MKTIVVVSSYIDATIRDEMKGTEFILFRTLEDLGLYIDMTPIRADSLFVTCETIRHTNSAISYLISLLESPFFRVDKVVYITKNGSRELPSIRYIIEEKSLSNWVIEEGNLTREFVSGIITGTARKSDETYNRKILYRVPRSSYVDDRIKNRSVLNEHYVSDDENLAEIPDVPLPATFLQERPQVCKQIRISGEECPERTAFAFVYAQYLSLSDKTIIIEKDIEYHTLSDFATKSGVGFLHILVEDVLADPNAALDKIRRSDCKLVCVLAHKRAAYSYEFLCGLLYNNLADSLSRLVLECNIAELPLTDSCILCLPTQLPQLLRVCGQLNASQSKNLRFIGVEMSSVRCASIGNSRGLTTILSDILEINDVAEVPIVALQSLKLGGDYALHGILE